MKKKIAVLMALVVLVCFAATGCTEADQVSSNISKEADNFNVTRKLTVLNARTEYLVNAGLVQIQKRGGDPKSPTEAEG